MVLTGKQSLDFSGGVSAEDNFGIGGYDRVMGPNGAGPVLGARPGRRAATSCSATTSTPTGPPGERGPRRATTDRPVDRDVRSPRTTCRSSDFTTVGDIFSAATNPDRKKPFDIRTVMRAVADQDHPPLERWAGMADAETRRRLDAHLGGRPVSMLGIESRPLPRGAASRPPTGRTPGPPARCSPVVEEGRPRDQRGQRQPAAWWSWRTCRASTARPSRCATCSSSTAPRSAGRSSTSTARSCSAWSRATTAARSWCSQGAEPAMKVLAVEGSFASVIGGAPAAAVVFAGEVDARTAADPRVAELRPRSRAADEAERAPLPPSWPRSGRRCGPRSSARSRPSSTPCTASSGPSGRLGRRGDRVARSCVPG